MSREKLNESGIILRSYAPGGHKTKCPQCSETRKNKGDLCLSVTVDEDGVGAVWQCHNCNWAGNVPGSGSDSFRQVVQQKPTKVEHTPSARGDKVDAWFAGRAIGRPVLDRAGVGAEETWMPGCQENSTVNAITFPYRRDGVTVNVKYRSGNKAFRQIKGAEKVYFGLDDIAGKAEIIVVEGEIDKLTLDACGFENSVSVPDGAPKVAKGDTPNPEDDTKFSYVWNCRDHTDQATRILIGTDMDAPGDALAEELARRYGKHRCWRINWPEKDANDTLVKRGDAFVRDVIANATPWPVKGLYSAGNYDVELLTQFRGEGEKGLSTGWADVDKLFTVRPGELTVVTGFPGSGKSSFIDAIMVHLASKNGWKFAKCSFETAPVRDIANLSEIKLGKGFWPGPNRMSEAQMMEGARWVGQHFTFIRASDESPTIDWILEMARVAVARDGIRGLLIDPYNEIEHKHAAGQSETMYVSQLLSKVKRFCEQHAVHCWFVAHPAKPSKDKNGKSNDLTLYDISGSANWNNKADIGYVVIRDPDTNKVTVDVKKVRFREVGQPGKAELEFDRTNGRYYAASPTMTQSRRDFVMKGETNENLD